MRLEVILGGIGVGLMILGAIRAPSLVYGPVQNAIDNGQQPNTVEGRWLCLDVPSGSNVRTFLRDNALSANSWWYLTSCREQPKKVDGSPAEALSALDVHGRPFWYAAGAKQWHSLPAECTAADGLPPGTVTCLTSPTR